MDPVATVNTPAFDRRQIYRPFLERDRLGEIDAQLGAPVHVETGSRWLAAGAPVPADGSIRVVHVDQWLRRF